MKVKIVSYYYNKYIRMERFADSQPSGLKKYSNMTRSPSGLQTYTPPNLMHSIPNRKTPPRVLSALERPVDLARIKHILEDLHVVTATPTPFRTRTFARRPLGRRALAPARTRVLGLECKHHIMEMSHEFRVFEKGVPPHGRDFFWGVAETRAEAARGLVGVFWVV
jgi:hypothetical protein